LLEDLRSGLEFLGLTWAVEARQLDDASVELLVGRLPQAGKRRDLVNIADVGFGVSQTLPVLVALLIAQPGQLVYLEQPEIHLHPRAQTAFATLLRRAAERGVQVVVETHSSLLIRGVQTLVAKGELSADKVALHWFARDIETGETTVTSATLDRYGSFGDWPEDFDEVNLRSDHDYLTAAEAAEAREASEE
jgi:predicted ATPase